MMRTPAQDVMFFVCGWHQILLGLPRREYKIKTSRKERYIKKRAALKANIELYEPYKKKDAASSKLRRKNMSDEQRQKYN